MASLLPVPAAPVARSIDAGEPAVASTGEAHRLDRGSPSGPQPHPWRSRLRKLALGLIVGAIGLEVLYVVGANAFFASKKIEGYISSEDGNFSLRYGKLRSWIPGRYHVEELTIQSRGLGVQWVLGIEQADFTTNPIKLIRRHFDVSEVTASGVSYRLRTTEPGAKAKRDETKGFPPIPGYDDLDPVPPAPPTPIDELWQVSIKNIDARAKEVWVQQFRHAGDMHAHGKFTLTPGLYFSVGPASIDFLGGPITVGKSVMASSLEGHAEALISPNSIIDPGRMSVLAQTDMSVTLNAQIDSVVGWQTFWPEGITLTDGSGQVSVRAGVTRGMIDGGSRASYETRHLVGHDGTITAVAPLSIAWQVADDGETSKLTADVPSATVSRQGHKGESPQLSAVKATFSTGPIDTAGFTELRHATASIGGFTAPDANFFNVEQLRELGFVFEHGVSKAHADFAFDAPETVSGNVRFTVEGLTARYDGDPIHSEVAFFGHVPPSRLSQGLTISSARLDLRDAFLHANGKKVDHWWARVDTTDAHLQVADIVKFKGPITLHGKDATPILAYALDDSGIQGELRDLVNTKALDAYADVAGEGQQLDLRIHSVKGGAYELNGRTVYRGGWCGAVLIERGLLSLGIKMEGTKNSLRPMVGQSWLAEHAGGPKDGQMRGCPLSRRQLRQQRAAEKHSENDTKASESRGGGHKTASAP